MLREWLLATRYFGQDEQTAGSFDKSDEGLMHFRPFGPTPQTSTCGRESTDGSLKMRFL